MLKVKINNIEFNSPIIASSGTFGYGDEFSDFVDLEKIGCIITKSITLEPRIGNMTSRIHEVNTGMINAIGLANLGVEKFCSEKISLLDKINTKYIVSIAGKTIDEYVHVLDKIENFGGMHVGYEINVSCPNVKQGGMEFGVDKAMTQKLTEKLRQLTDRLLIIKLSPNVTKIQDIAKASENGGADCVSAINTLVGMGIDIKNRKPKLHTVYGGLSGPAIKPIALANVHKIYKAVKIPIIGLGGIQSATDIIEFILAGADMVQIGTLNYKEPGIGVRLVSSLEKYLKENKINTISELKGQLII